MPNDPEGGKLAEQTADRQAHPARSAVVRGIVLVTGGCRSGKSGYAQSLAESLPPSRLYVATCPVTDEEMRTRIEEHRRARHNRGWETIEEQVNLARVLSRNGHHNVLLIECVTLWVNNLMYHAARLRTPTHGSPGGRAVLAAVGCCQRGPRRCHFRHQRGRPGRGASRCRGTSVSRPARPREPDDRRTRGGGDAGFLRNTPSPETATVIMNLLTSTVAQIVPQDPACRRAAKDRLDRLIMPHWALGRLMDLAMDLAGMTRSVHPTVARKTIVTMAGDHGVAAEGISKYPQEVTPQMVHGFVAGMAGISALARLAGARVLVVDMGVAADLSRLAGSGKILDKKIAMGTANIALGPAMTRKQAVRSVEAGIEVVADLSELTDVFGTGDMGIANTTPSTAVVASLAGLPVAGLTGRGTGIDDGQLAKKIAVVEKALAVNRPDPSDALDVLAKVGGFEIGGIAGVVLGAAARRKPVVVDGFISTAGALVAHALCALSAQYVIAAHRSAEPGHRAMHARLGKEPLLDLGLRLGEGTGACLAMNLVEAAQRILCEVATFDEAHVSKAE